MAADPIGELLLVDLRHLRRMPGDVELERIVQLETLVQFVGAGSVEQTYSALLELRRLHAPDAESDIGAYFFTAGLDVGKFTLDQRLSRYAEAHHVNPRTALRRSDRGALKLSAIIRDSLEFDRPWCRMIAIQNGPVCQFSLYVELDANADWRRPHVFINCKRDRDIEFPLRNVEGRERRLSCLVRLPDQHLDTSVGELGALAFVQVIWAMPIWPAWDVVAHMADNRLLVHLDVQRAGTAQVNVEWSTAGAAESRGTPLVHFSEWL